MILRTLLVPDRYLDSVFLMGLAERLRRLPGIEDASAVMGTEANKDLLRETGLLDEEARSARATDIIVSVRAGSEEAAQAAREELLGRLGELGGPGGARTPVEGAAEEGAAQGMSAAAAAAAGLLPATLEQAVARRPGASLAIVSLPGSYVRREVLKALELGLHAFVFSDNVSVEDEVLLKARGRELGLLVMGPDCGTAILEGVALGFANAVERGPVGIIGASGTGIQELSCLLDRRGLGIHQAIGVGGRDLGLAVGGSSMLQALDLLEDDPLCQVIALVSKPPHPRVAETVLERARVCKKPCLVCFLGGEAAPAEQRGLPFASRLDLAAERVEQLLRDEPVSSGTRELAPALQGEARARAVGLAPGRHLLRALYSGGTLCEEAILCARELLPDSYRTNLEHQGPGALGQDDRCPGRHLFLDLGDDRYTRGRPHPMIDFSTRTQRLKEEAARSDTAVILFDLVCGHGAHPDPAGELAPVIAPLAARPDGPLFVASVTATEKDPQPYSSQRALLEQAGVRVLECNADAAAFAAALVAAIRREP